MLRTPVHGRAFLGRAREGVGGRPVSGSLLATGTIGQGPAFAKRAGVGFLGGLIPFRRGLGVLVRWGARGRCGAWRRHRAAGGGRRRTIRLYPDTIKHIRVRPASANLRKLRLKML